MNALFLFLPLQLKVMLHETIFNDDFKRNVLLWQMELVRVTTSLLTSHDTTSRLSSTHAQNKVAFKIVLCNTNLKDTMMN